MCCYKFFSLSVFFFIFSSPLFSLFFSSLLFSSLLFSSLFFSFLFFLLFSLCFILSCDRGVVGGHGVCLVLCVVCVVCVRCCVWCVWCVCCVLGVCVWCAVCVLRHAEKTWKNLCVLLKTPPCVDSKRPRVCRQHAHMLFSMRAWCRYTRGRFECTHGGVFKRTHGEQGIIASSAYQKLPT